MDRAALRADFHRWGMGRTVARAAYAAARRRAGLRLYRFMALDAGRLRRELVSTATAFTGRFLSPDEVRTLGTDAAGEMTLASIERLLARQDLCYGLFAEGRLACSGWYTTASATAQGLLSVSFNPEYHYMYGGYTRPEYRGRGLLAHNLARACAGLYEQGSAGLVTLAERVNYAAIGPSHRVGFVDCGLAAALPVRGRWCIWQTRPRAPYLLRLRARTGAAT